MIHHLFTKFTIAPKRAFTLVVTMLVIVFSVTQTRHLVACSWSENSETVRLAFFQARYGTMYNYEPFYYSYSLYYSAESDRYGNDRWRNCREWQQDCGSDVVLTDIESMIYKVPADLFVLAANNNTLTEMFAGNTFAQWLARKDSKAYLDYLVVARHIEQDMEWLNNPWESPQQSYYYGDVPRKLYPKGDSLLSMIQQFNATHSIPRLQRRYAFQKIKLEYSLGNYAQCSDDYRAIFRNDTSTIIGVWAMMYHALSLYNIGRQNEAQYIMSLVFRLSDEKKLRMSQSFCDSFEKVSNILHFAKNSTEASTMLSMVALRYPGPALKQLKQIDSLDNFNSAIDVLILRELTKFDEWIVANFRMGTSEVYESSTDSTPINADSINHFNDLQRVAEFQTFLQSLLQRSTLTRERKAFLHCAMAHLYYLTDDVSKGNSTMALIPDDIGGSIALQRSVERLFVNARHSNLSNDDVRTEIANDLVTLQAAIKYDPTPHKVLHTVYQELATAFQRSGDVVWAGLFFAQASHERSRYEIRGNQRYVPSDSQWSEFSIYTPEQSTALGYFDTHATISDIDRVLSLVQSTNLTPFEKICLNPQLLNKNALYDLKGTIAFRSGDLKTAYIAFTMVDNFYYKNKATFGEYLNEDPFEPKKPQSEKRIFTYLFNKSDFVMQLRSLEDSVTRKPEKSPEYNLLLGNAWFNCSHKGNAWMMTRNSWSRYERNPLSQQNNQLTFQKYVLTEQDKNIGWYYDNSRAATYYKKVIDAPNSTEEQKATALYMLHVCEYSALNIEFYTNDSYNEMLQSVQAQGYNPSPLKTLYQQYQKTQAFARYRCPLMDDFVATF